MDTIEKIENNLSLKEKQAELEKELFSIIKQYEQAQSKCTHIGISYENNECKCLLCSKDLNNKEIEELDSLNKIVYAQDYLIYDETNFQDKFEMTQMMFEGLCRQHSNKNEVECVCIFNQMINDVCKNRKNKKIKPNINSEYRRIIEKRKILNKKIQLLENNKFVKEYILSQEENEDLYSQELNLYKKIETKKYSSCNHVLVYSKIDYDKHEGRKYTSCGCIKCGLDNSVLDNDRKYLDYKEKIMYDFLQNEYLYGRQLDVTCDTNLAHAIYSKIKEYYPNINDKMAIKYFEIALDNIRNIPVTNERKENRAKRLSLEPNFNRWNASSVHNY